MELDMECRASLIYAQLVLPELDLDEVRYGQLLTILTALVVLFLLAMISGLGAL
jgi:hypothetical protein